jgi:hypothetical protein
VVKVLVFFMQRIFWLPKIQLGLLILVLHVKCSLSHHTQNMFQLDGKATIHLRSCSYNFFFAPVFSDLLSSRYRAPEVLLQSPAYDSAVGKFALWPNQEVPFINR